MNKTLTALLLALTSAWAVDQNPVVEMDKEQTYPCKRILIAPKTDTIEDFFKNKKNIQKVLYHNQMGFYKIKDKDLYIYAHDMYEEPNLNKEKTNFYFSPGGILGTLSCECTFNLGWIKPPPHYDLIKKLSRLDSGTDQEITDFLNKTFKLYVKKGKGNIAIYYMGNDEKDYTFLKDFFL